MPAIEKGGLRRGHSRSGRDPVGGRLKRVTSHCADLFKRNRDAIDGVITLPNFGEERAIADTLGWPTSACRCWCKPPPIPPGS